MRPTADRVREALFARLGDLEGARVLDLYAGTGALGIEALSRGAGAVVFVERSGPAVAGLRRNLERLGLSGRARVVRADVRGALRRLAREAARFHLVLADPPYAAPDVAESLSWIARGGLLLPGGTVVVERGRRHPLAAVEGLVEVESRRYGDTVVVWLEPPGPGEPRAPGAPEASGDPASGDPGTDAAARPTAKRAKRVSRVRRGKGGPEA